MRLSILIIAALGGLLLLAGLMLARRDIPAEITYGVSFSKLHAEELGLDWKETYSAILHELKPKHLRLSAHWPMLEPRMGEFNFEELDYQMRVAAENGADVILAVGRRAPGWPECHVPDWAVNLSQEERDARVLLYMTMVVERYKNAANLRYFQVENEPFLHFAPQYCGEFDPAFLTREIEHVKLLAPEVPILVTDSGEMGKWYGAWQAGDIFGTSVYLYVWYNPFGPVRYPMGPAFFRIKQNVAEFFLGEKKTMLIELGMEPWLNKPIVAASVAEQLERMGPEKIEEIIAFAAETGFDEHYLWGAEWWYYLHVKHGNDWFWKRAQELFASSK